MTKNQTLPFKPIFFGGEIFRRRGYPKAHPLAIPRVGTVVDLCTVLGWLPGERYRGSTAATVEELARFHDRDYIAALRQAQDAGYVQAEHRARYNIGTFENPWFETMYDRAAICCGGSIAAARAILCGGSAFAPAGGMHHGHRGRASGFCYFNDPVLAIYALLDGGLSRIYYADIDGHHGDGVEAAFAGDPRVVMISVHEAGRWPGTGRRSGQGCGNAYNIPVPAGLNDSEMELIISRSFLPLAESVRPEAVVVTCGADALADDPLTGLSLSNRALWRAVASLAAVAPRVLVLGGGGYNPWSAARCWSGVWAMLNGIRVPERLPGPAVDLLRRIDWDFDDGEGVDGNGRPERWFATLADPPREGPVRDEIRELAASVLV